VASNSKSNGLGGVPWTVVVPVIHALIDLASNAHCPDCGNQVVLYVCVNCKKPVWPERGQAAA
jgi:DNA-directed RNA polymerase subunit RPC12/RpoP